MSDVCLILEGTYPYVSGGVSTWVHELIRSQSHLTFSLVCLLPPDGKTKSRYTLPDNVTQVTHIFLQKLPKGVSSIPQSQKFFQQLELPILHLQYTATKETLKSILETLKSQPVGSQFLLNSEEAWQMLLRMYRSSIGEGSFLNFFWSWRGLLAGMYSVLLADLPSAKLYHSLCTGYAGLYLARAHLETGKPCMLTEHGIYTNERRIEITAAQWLNDQKAMNLNIIRPHYERDLKDYWIDTFSGYSKICYEVCQEIITLYEGNKAFQVEDGAPEEKIRVIPNGVDYDHYAAISRDKDHPPTVALIGRVVSIKDVKTFIRAVVLLKESIPDVRVWVMGPTDVEEEYYQECIEIVEKRGLTETVTFTGKVTIDHYLGQIDVVVLSSISEAQPLVILEAGAAGIPCVVTDVGACRELVFGRSDENPPIGQAGEICQLSNPVSVAESLIHLLTDQNFYQSCSRAIQERVKTYYHKKDQKSSYEKVYQTLMEQSWQE